MKRKSQTKHSKIQTQKILDAAKWHSEMFKKYGEDYYHLSENELIEKQKKEKVDLEKMKKDLEKMKRDVVFPSNRRHRSS